MVCDVVWGVVVGFCAVSHDWDEAVGEGVEGGREEEEVGVEWGGVCGGCLIVYGIVSDVRVFGRVAVIFIYYGFSSSR